MPSTRTRGITVDVHGHRTINKEYRVLVLNRRERLSGVWNCPLTNARGSPDAFSGYLRPIRSATGAPVSHL